MAKSVQVNRLRNQTRPTFFGPRLSRVMTRYYRGPNHPFKLRLVRWIERALGSHRIVADINYGLKMALDKRCLVQRELLYKGTFEEEILQTLSSEIRPNDIFYDIGANVGLHSCVVLKAGAGQAVLFEPDRLNSSVAQLNLQLNGFANFVLLELALDEMHGKRTFFGASPDNTGTGGFSRVDHARSFSVPVECLDDVVAKFALPHP